MTYYIRDRLPPGPVCGARRSTINEFFLSSYTLGIYAGCEFGCPYCDGWVYHDRPLNEQVRVPLDMPGRLKEEFETMNRGELVGITALSDPYQPVEQNYRITRQVLQVFADVGQPCTILTKGIGVLEDLPLIQRINEQSLAMVIMTILTVDPYLAERLDGKSPPPGLRLDILSQLKRAGIPIGVAIAPILPYVNDTNYVLSGLLRACSDVGVDFVLWDYLHIPDRIHFNRVNELLLRIGTYPTSYYRDLYPNHSMPIRSYRTERNAALVHHCDMLALNIRPPHKFYEGVLTPRNEAALLLKHHAFRDMTQGRQHIANMHRSLADFVYHGKETPEQLNASPLWPTIRMILGY